MASGRSRPCSPRPPLAVPPLRSSFFLSPPVGPGAWAVNPDCLGLVAARMGGWTRTAPADWVFDDHLFYDTFYHLNRTGRDVRTEQLARVLQTETVSAR